MINQLTIDHSSSIPLHIQVENTLRDLILGPAITEGTLLPRETDIAKKLGVARNTVRQAIGKLVQDGLVERKKRFGTVVQSKVVNTKLDSWRSFTQEMNEQGIPFINYLIKTTIINPNIELKEKLNLLSDNKVVKLERIRGMEDGPFVYFISYFHPRIGLSGNENFEKPLYEMLEREYSTPVSKSKEKISALLADKNIANKLHINKGEPILFRERFVYDPGERIVEYNIGYYRADKFTYSIEITR